MRTVLSILICTIPERWAMFYRLLSNVSKQITNLASSDFHKEKYSNVDVQVIWNTDLFITSRKSVGYKREELLKKAKGEFIVFVDDDDEISDDYVKLIVDTILDNPGIGCIGIKGKISFDGQRENKWEISNDFLHWFEKDGVYYRTPNHISPVRRDLALMAGFPDISFGEDAEYSRRLKKILLEENHKEAKIDKEIYHYKFISNK